MLEKIYIVTDLGPGDGGKGGVVHRISSLMKASCIIKRGGAQGSHGVQTSAGQKFNFSQWGCGTFDNIPTFLSKEMIVSPEGLLNEADHLKYQAGIDDPFSMLTVDPDCLCATPFHGIASRLIELSKLDNPRGTIGTGVGEAYRDSLINPNQAIYVKDLFDPYIDQKLEEITKSQRDKLLPIIESPVLKSDGDLKQSEIELLFDDKFIKYVQQRFKKVAKLIRPSYIEEVLSKSGVAVIENSHGVINDSELGHKPHVSAIRTVPLYSNNMLLDANFSGKTINIGVFRAYAIRHGAGPMPTSDDSMIENLLPNSSKYTNRWQGKVRVGALDFNQLQMALKICRPIAFDGLAITWFDQIKKNGVWDICDEYSDGVPTIKRITIPPNFCNDKLYNICAKVIEKHLAVPVRMVSFGPTESDKILK